VPSGTSPALTCLALEYGADLVVYLEPFMGRFPREIAAMGIEPPLSRAVPFPLIPSKRLVDLRERLDRHLGGSPDERWMAFAVEHDDDCPNLNPRVFRAYGLLEILPPLLTETMADIGRPCEKRLFDHFFGSHSQLGRNFDAKCCGGFDINRQDEPRRLIDRQIGGFCALKNLVHIAGESAAHRGIFG
jgi:hypothetical protein